MSKPIIKAAKKALQTNEEQIARLEAKIKKLKAEVVGLKKVKGDINSAIGKLNKP